MRALPARSNPIWRIELRERYVMSLWFIPTCFTIGAIVLANLSIWLDDQIDAPVAVRWLLVSDPSTAASLAGTIAAATLAFVAVVFATTLVAIQLAASQYSPRAVRIFIRARATRVTLGLFLATFVFALVMNLSNRADVASARQFAPVASVACLLALMLATVLGFVFYLHAVVRLMRVQYLLETVAEETRISIDRNFPPASGYVDAEEPARDPAPVLLTYGGPAGVVSANDLGKLAEVARQASCWIELRVGVGEYLATGTPIALVHGGGVGVEEIMGCFLVGGERTFLQDPGFGFRQIVDIAIRALSPAVNDPTTGVQSIDRLNDLLAIVGIRPQPTGWRVDEQGTARILRKIRPFPELIELSVVEIIRYGADSPQVVRRLRALFDELEATCPDRIEAIGRQRELLDAAVAQAMPAAFAVVAGVSDREGLG